MNIIALMKVGGAKVEAARRWDRRRASGGRFTDGLAFEKNGECLVGLLAPNGFYEVILGRGATFEEAFAAADARGEWICDGGNPVDLISGQG